MLRTWLVVGLLLWASPLEAQPVFRMFADRTSDTLSSNGDSLIFVTQGLASARIQTLDSYSGTWEVQCSTDNGATYDTDNELDLDLDGSSAAPAQSVTDAVGLWLVNVAGCTHIKVIATAGFAASDTVVSVSAVTTGGSGGSGGSSGGTVAISQTGDENLVDIGLINGVAPAFNEGTKGATVLRVTLATDDEANDDLDSINTEMLAITHAEDSVHSSGHAGIMLLAIRQDSQADFGADGDYVPFSVNDAGELRVAFSGAAGGTSLADDADFTAGTTPFTPVGGFYQSSITACTDGDTCAAGVTAGRAWRVHLTDAAGASLTVASDATIGSAGPATGPFVTASYKDFDGSALPTTTNVNTEEEAAPFAVSLVGVQYVMLTSENGATSPIIVDDAAATTGGSVIAIGARADDTATDSVDEDDVGYLRMSLDRLLYTRFADPCSGGATKLYLPFDITTATTTEITPSLAGASNHYYICALNIVTTAANNVNLVDDNSDNCASVTASLISSGLAAGDGWGFGANGGLTLGNGLGSIMRTQTTNSVLCLVTSAATELHGQFVVVAAP